MLVRGANMIKTYGMLLDEYKDYCAPDNKVSRMIKDGCYIKIRRGLYETERNLPGYYFAELIYGPSYLSFDFALSYYGLIPEKVYNYSSATFNKRKKKKYINEFGTFYYRDVPTDIFPVGVDIKIENGYTFKIATPEKALCDKLYTIKPLGSQKEIMICLFDDLRIDEDAFQKLNIKRLLEICDLYPSTNVKLLKKVVKRYYE